MAEIIVHPFAILISKGTEKTSRYIKFGIFSISKMSNILSHRSKRMSNKFVSEVIFPIR